MAITVPLDPELAAALPPPPGPQPFDFNDPVGSRARAMARRPIVPPSDAVDTEDRMIPGPAGSPDVRVRIFRPKGVTGVLPGLCWIHGGGMILGTIDGDNPRLSEWAVDLPCVAVTIDYRLAPENPHPAPVEDCYAGLVWMASHAAELGVDPDRIAIGGPSAGSGLAAGVALMARDLRGPQIAFQMLIYPMLDDRNTNPSTLEQTATGAWDRATNLGAWKAYLGDASGKDDVSPYAAPARVADVSGLPPAFIDVGTADMFRDEDIIFAQRLMQAGVPTELHVYPGAFHGFDGMAPTAAVSLAAKALRTAALKKAFSKG